MSGGKRTILSLLAVFLAGMTALCPLPHRSGAGLTRALESQASALPTNDATPIQPQAARFERLTTADGLPDDTVTAILQDQQGFMWFATVNGLAQYDGYDFTVYSSRPDEATSLAHPTIYTLLESSDGELWLGTHEGLDRLDRATGTFIHYLSGRAILSLYEEQDGTFWVGTSFGMTSFDPANPAPSPFYRGPSTDVDDPRRLSASLIQAIYEDRAGELWIGTDAGSLEGRGGLDLFDRATNTFIHHRHDPDDPASLAGNSVRAILEDRQGVLWVGTDGGLSRMDRSSQTFVRYKHDPDDPDSLAGDSVQSILEDRAGRLWIGTDSGLDQLDPDRNRFVHFKHDGRDPQSLAANEILTIYEDRSGVVWIGTTSGLSKYDETASQFSLYQHFADVPESLSDNLVLAIHEDRDGTLWVGTGAGGLNRLDYESGTWTAYRHDPADPTSLSSNGVTAIYEDRAGTLWLGTDSRWLEQFDPHTESFIHHTYLSAAPASVMAEDAGGNLWIGTGYGLYYLDLVSVKLTHFAGTGGKQNLSSADVVALWVADSGEVVVGTQGGGINIWYPDDELFARFGHDPNDPNSLSSNAVFAFHMDVEQNVAWLGTWAGLDRYDGDTGRMTHYTTEDGLPDVPVIGIVPDTQGYLWLATQWGLSRFDPQSGTFRNFDARDGLQGGRFVRTAHATSASGRIFFGGTSGLNAFYPERIPRNPHSPPVVITALSLFNEVMRTDLLPDEQIELTYQQNFVSFEFAALDYTAPERNQYAYRLEGVDPDWVSAGTRRRADYPDLGPGEYIFRVKASNNDGLWNEEGVALHLTITPPFWGRWWFQGLLGLLIAGIAVAGYRLRVRSLEARSHELETQVARRTVELEREMDQRMQVEKALRQSEAEIAVAEERNRLARDLHDAVTQSLYSLTLLAEAGQRFAETGDLERVRGYQSRIGEIGQQALNEMRLLIYELRPPELESAGLVGALRQRLEAVEERVGIEVHLLLEGGAGTVQLPAAVEEALFRIAQEALNNVLRHAAATAVRVRLFVDPDDPGQRVELEVTDNGKGFDPDTALNAGGMGLANMRERARKLGAELTVHSSPGEGTSTSVFFGSHKAA